MQEQGNMLSTLTYGYNLKSKEAYYCCNHMSEGTPISLLRYLFLSMFELDVITVMGDSSLPFCITSDSDRL